MCMEVLDEMIEYYEQCRGMCRYNGEYTYNSAFLDGSIHALKHLRDELNDY